jgi:hypothetical protein
MYPGKAANLLSIHRNRAGQHDAFDARFYRRLNHRCRAADIYPFIFLAQFRRRIDDMQEGSQ